MLTVTAWSVNALPHVDVEGMQLIDEKRYKAVRQ